MLVARARRLDIWLVTLHVSSRALRVKAKSEISFTFSYEIGRAACAEVRVLLIKAVIINELRRLGARFENGSWVFW